MTSVESNDVPETQQPVPLAAYEPLKEVVEKGDVNLSVEVINRLVLREHVAGLIRKVTELENSLDNQQDDFRRERRGIFLKLLPLMDSLDRMIRQVDPENELAASLEALRSQFLGILEEQDTVPIPLEVGQKVDLTLCDISRQQRRSDLEPDLIIQVDRRGYLYQSKVLRKARAVISTLP